MENDNIKTQIIGQCFYDFLRKNYPQLVAESQCEGEVERKNLILYSDFLHQTPKGKMASVLKGIDYDNLSIDFSWIDQLSDEEMGALNQVMTDFPYTDSDTEEEFYMSDLLQAVAKQIHKPTLSRRRINKNEETK